MTIYLDVCSGSKIELPDSEIVFMNIHNVAQAVSSWDDGEMPTTYDGSISDTSVEAAGVQLNDEAVYESDTPFSLSDGVYWELEALDE
jgi:hypothetical protein